MIAGDNLFDYALADFIAYWRGKPNASAVAVYDVGNPELAKLYGIVEVDERPHPGASSRSRRAAEHARRDGDLSLLPGARPARRDLLAGGNPPDQPGNFVAWLATAGACIRRTPSPASWYDIGDAEQLLAADNRLRERAGLSLRDSYSLD